MKRIISLLLIALMLATAIGGYSGGSSDDGAEDSEGAGGGGSTVSNTTTGSGGAAGGGTLTNVTEIHPTLLVKLNVPFELAETQESVVTDYGNMRIVLKDISVVIMGLRDTAPEYRVYLAVFAPDDVYKTADYGTSIVLTTKNPDSEIYGAKISLLEANKEKATIVVKKEKQELVYVKLNQDFTLAINQEAQVVDFNNLGIKLIKTFPQTCSIDGSCTENIPSAQIEVLGETITGGNTSTREIAFLTIVQGQAANVFGAAIRLNRVSSDKAGLRVEKQGVIYCEEAPFNEDCFCKEGRKIGVAKAHRVGTPQEPIRYECSTEAIYVKLNEKFQLKQEQTAILTDFKRLEMKLNYIVVQGESAPESITSQSTAIKPEEQQVTSDYIPPELYKAKYYANADVSYGISNSGSNELQNLNIPVGGSKEVYGIRLNFLSVYNNGGALAGVFAFEKLETIPDAVDIGVEPRERKIMEGDKATYKVTIVDKHSRITCNEGQICPLSERPYRYKLQVIGLPFSAELPEEILLGAGDKTEVKLVVDTANNRVVEPAEEVSTTQTATSQASTSPAVSEKKQITRITTKAVADMQKRCLYTDADYETCLREKVVRQTGDIAIARPEPDSSTRAYKFAVRAIGTDNDNSNSIDVAYAALLVAAKPQGPTPPIPPGKETVDIELSSGWNLIALPKISGKANEGSCGDLAGFVYLPEEKKFVSLEEAQRLFGDKLFDYLSKHAFWVYSKKGCSFSAEVESKPSYSSMNLIGGWNLVPITEELTGKSFQNVAENCDVSRIYFWNAKEQKWEAVKQGYTFSRQQIYKGMAVRSSNYCELGETVVAPPPFPEEAK